MFTLSNLLFALIIFLACIVSGLVGFGSNILALPLLSFFFDTRVIVPVLILTVLFNGLPRLLTQYRSVNLPVYLTMLPLALLGGFLGIHMVNILPESWMKLLLAFLMLLIATKGLLEQRGIWNPQPKKSKNPLLLLIPLFGGMMQAAFACGGPVFNLYILLKLQQKEQIRATMFAIGATSAGIIALQYLLSGVYQGQVLQLVGWLIPAALLAYMVSERLFRQINGQQFLQLLSAFPLHQERLSPLQLRRRAHLSQSALLPHSAETKS